MSRIILARHGETVWHAENRYAGRSDIELTPLGQQQAEQLATWAMGQNIDHVVCSPLVRALKTAQPAANALGVSIRTDLRLQELDFGRGEGMTDAEMSALFPEERTNFLADPARHPLPEGENPRAAVARGVAALQEIARTAPDARTLVVTHNTLIRLVLCELLGISLSRYRQLFPQLANGTTTEIDLSESGFALLSFNAPIPQQS